MLSISHGTPEPVCSVTNPDISSTVALYEMAGGAQKVSLVERIDLMSSSVAMLCGPVMRLAQAASRSVTLQASSLNKLWFM